MFRIVDVVEGTISITDNPNLDSGVIKVNYGHYPTTLKIACIIVDALNTKENQDVLDNCKG